MNLMGETKHEASGLPIGVKVDARSAKRPVRTTHSGRYVIVAPLDPLAHAQSLYEGTHEVNKEAFWLYMSEGPFADAAAFRVYFEKLACSEDPLSFSIVDPTTTLAVGHASQGIWRRVQGSRASDGDPGPAHLVLPALAKWLC